MLLRPRISKPAGRMRPFQGFCAAQLRPFNYAKLLVIFSDRVQPNNRTIAYFILLLVTAVIHYGYANLCYFKFLTKYVLFRFICNLDIYCYAMNFLLRNCKL